MQIANVVRGDRIWAIVMRGNANKLCWRRDYWTFFATGEDIPWPVAHATVGTGEYCSSMGSKAKAYIDWIDVPENQRGEGWGTAAVLLMQRHYGSIDYTSNDTDGANAFWEAFERNPHSQAAKSSGVAMAHGEKTALPDKPAVAPGSMPSSANSAASAVNDSDVGGGE